MDDEISTDQYIKAWIDMNDCVKASVQWITTAPVPRNKFKLQAMLYFISVQSLPKSKKAVVFL